MVKPEPQFYEPKSFYKGDTVRWYKKLENFPASDGGSLVYYFASGDFITSVKSTPQSDYYSMVISSEQSKLWQVGKYQWQAKILDDDSVTTVNTGNLIVHGTLTEKSQTDRANYQSQAEQTIANIDRYMADPKNLVASSVTIGSKQITQYHFSELIELRNYYMQIVKNEIGKNVPHTVRRVIPLAKY